MTIEITSGEANAAGGAVLLPILKDADRRAALTRIAEQWDAAAEPLLHDFQADTAETQLLYSSKEGRLWLLGLGEAPSFSEILKAFRSFSHKQRRRLPARLQLDLRHLPQPGAVVEAAVNGLLLGSYRIGRFKTDEPDEHPLANAEATLTVAVPAAATEAARRAAERGRILAETQQSIFDLVNAPSNKKRPADLAAWAERSGEAHGYTVKVFHKKEIEHTGLNALLAVSQGSDAPPAFIVMEYRPEEGPANATVGLVGKGVTFDTGGVSIKPSSNMYYMKSDMGGAAAVFGAMEAAARLQLPVHLIGVVPATENSVDAKAVKPSDVIESYSGKTIEIIDTDAEGRLILADGLAYLIQQYQPEVVIDLATLTGSAVRTFGYHAGALFSNDDALATHLAQAGADTGERVWRLPLWKVYEEETRSDVADIRNLGSRPMAGAIFAAKFLQAFTFEHPRWAHLDIAGVAFQDSEFSGQKSATAFGVRLLIRFLELLTTKD